MNSVKQAPTEIVDSTAPVSRLERRKIEFRDKITHSALKLFAENGVTETSVASIIREADIAHKTFFNHFPSKDHLLQHIVSTHSHYAYTLFREALKKFSDPRKQLEFCLIQVAKALEPMDPEKYKELVTFYFVSNTSTKDFRNEQKQNFIALIQGILQDAREQKLLCSGFTEETLTNIIVALTVSNLLNWCMEEQYPIVAQTRQAVKFINQTVFVSDS